MVSNDGTEYQTVMPCASMKRAVSTGNIVARAGASTNVAARTRRGEEVEDRQIEVERCHAREHVVRVHPELVGRPQHEGERVAMRQHDALRPAGGPRRIEDVGEVGIDPPHVQT